MRFLVFLSFLLGTTILYALPHGFVYLQNVDSTIVQEMRYAGYHNFVGRPINGYLSPTCILTKEAALALKKVQIELNTLSLSLKVYDCYRPIRAVTDFINWSQNYNLQQMKAEFYPRVNKADFFKLGYVAEKSGHTRGSTVDLTIVPLPVPSQPVYHLNQKLIACTESYTKRFADNSIDMGTGYDCIDKKSHVFNKTNTQLALKNRLFLQEIMIKHGFVPYENEWWHFTLKNEPYPNTYFDFLVR